MELQYSHKAVSTNNPNRAEELLRLVAGLAKSRNQNMTRKNCRLIVGDYSYLLTQKKNDECSDQDTCGKVIV